jgi:hypothetical protein
MNRSGSGRKRCALFEDASSEFAWGGGADIKTRQNSLCVAGPRAVIRTRHRSIQVIISKHYLEF